jgi:hypothetical protein
MLEVLRRVRIVPPQGTIKLFGHFNLFPGSRVQLRQLLPLLEARAFQKMARKPQDGWIKGSCHHKPHAERLVVTLKGNLKGR